MIQPAGVVEYLNYEKNGSTNKINYKGVLRMPKLIKYKGQKCWEITEVKKMLAKKDDEIAELKEALAKKKKGGKKKDEEPKIEDDKVKGDAVEEDEAPPIPGWDKE